MFVGGGGGGEGSICVSVCAAGVSVFGAWELVYVLYIVCVC